MENYQTIQPEFDGQVVTLWLSRPEVHNALNRVMIREIDSFFSSAEEMDEIRIVIIRGRGKSFCSGADLQWMKDAFNLSQEENLKESRELSEMFSAIFESSKIVVAAIHGNVYGGGNGLAAVCDLAYCVDGSRFCLSETRIGMAAATITPYLLQKINASHLKELIFSAKTFHGEEAVRYGLVNQSFPSVEALDHSVKETITEILANGKQALAASKRLINKITFQGLGGEMNQIPELLAQIRVSPEAREGFAAFLEKRKPNW
ncbi:MAG TPA: enoyl-CoA hydratase-related protein [Prolixibacteraceae bacterium]|nr:enoyl-CoA hydratase-related protein [Prolixibacteraceae bacterium]